MRVAVRVAPGSARESVGGRWRDALVVRVSAPAVDGRATDAALALIAAAFGVRRPAVTLLHGARSRDKVVDVDAPEAVVRERLQTLLDR